MKIQKTKLRGGGGWVGVGGGSGGGVRSGVGVVEVARFGVGGGCGDMGDVNHK